MAHGRSTDREKPRRYGRPIDASANIPHAVRTLDRLSSEGLTISIVTVGQIFEGAFGLPDPEDALETYRAFLAGFVVLSPNEAVMVVFAGIRSRLRRRGELVPDLDLLVAATAIAHDMVLLTRNRKHFERIPELNLSRAG